MVRVKHQTWSDLMDDLVSATLADPEHKKWQPGNRTWLYSRVVYGVMYPRDPRTGDQIETEKETTIYVVWAADTNEIVTAYPSRPRNVSIDF